MRFCPFHLSSSFIWVAIISWETLKWLVACAGEFLNTCCTLVRWNPVLCYCFSSGSNFNSGGLSSVMQLQSRLRLLSAVMKPSNSDNNKYVGYWNFLLRKLTQKITEWHSVCVESAACVGTSDLSGLVAWTSFRTYFRSEWNGGVLCFIFVCFSLFI